MDAQIVLLPGDGIGPEIVAQGRRVLETVARTFGHRFEFRTLLMGGCAIDAHGAPLTEETLEACRASDAILLGAVGGPKWDDPAAKTRPEAGLLRLRKELDLFANLRPIKPHASGEEAYSVMSYSTREIERVVRLAAEAARKRRGKLTSVDKANVLEVSRLWRQVARGVVEKEFADLKYDVVLVDAMAMYLISRPRDFDVVVTGNMFGDILTDEGSMLTGSLGLLPSASIGASGPGLYEPIHGSAPDIAGKGIANPLATILAAAMLLRHSLALEAEAAAVESAVERVLEAGHRTADIAAGKPSLGTVEMSTRVVETLGA